MIVKLRYSCSVNITLTIWCENVMRERETMPLLLEYTASEKP